MNWLKPHYTAFTLIELLIVIVIIGILAVALIPRLVGSQARARDTARKADVRQIQNAFATYAADNKGNYPQINYGCIGLDDGEKCRLWYKPNPPDPRVGVIGNTQLNNILKQYLTSIPSDPIPNRDVWDRYIYVRPSYPLVINCVASGSVSNKAFILRQPEKTNPKSDKECSPWRFACCSSIGCDSNMFFCALQIED